MFGRWQKASETLSFAIHRIHLKKQVDSLFFIDWNRGKSSGRSFSVVPVDRLITSNTFFEFRCTVFQNRADGLVCPKILKITLVRMLDRGKERVFGRLSINVGQFVNQSNVVLKSEMETGHTDCPVIDASYTFSLKGAARVVSPADEPESSGRATPSRDSIALDQWDASDDERDALPAEIASPAKVYVPHKKRHKPNHEIRQDELPLDDGKHKKRQKKDAEPLAAKPEEPRKESEESKTLHLRRRTDARPGSDAETRRD
jgi:hypothetical protein